MYVVREWPSSKEKSLAWELGLRDNKQVSRIKDHHYIP